MLELFITIICITAIFYYAKNRRIFGVTFNSIWLIIFLMIMTDYIVISFFTKQILAIMVLCVNIGYHVSNLINSISYDNHEIQILNTSFNRRIFNIINLFVLLILLRYFLRTIQLYGIDLKSIRSSNRFENQVFSGIVDSFLFYFVCSSSCNFGVIAIVYCALNKIKVYISDIIILFINIGLVIIVDAGRVLLVRILFFSIAGYFFIYENNLKGIKVSKKNFCTIVLFFLSMLVITTSMRTHNEASFLIQTIDYFSGAVVHMDYQIMLESNPIIYYGYIVYGGFFYYIIKIINIIGFGYLNSNEIMNFLQSSSSIIVHNRDLYYNALVPNAYYYYYDSGILGVIIFSFILGYFSSFYERPKKFTFMSFTMCCISFFALIYSPIGAAFWNFRLPSVLIYSFILKKFIFSYPNDNPYIHFQDTDYFLIYRKK